MKNSKGDAQRWLRQAENDLEAARILLREGFFSQVCFAAHQVAEKVLKALAYYRGDRHVVGHSLLELLQGLGTTPPQLSRIETSPTSLASPTSLHATPMHCQAAYPSRYTDRNRPRRLRKVRRRW